jgi:hypothetical protein
VNSIQYVPVESLTPTPENWKLYNRPTIDDPSFCELVDSVSEEGVKEPLTISEDNFILSGHRRHAAAEMLGVREVPTIVHPIMIGPMSSGERVKILVEHNRGARVKTDSERIRESLAQVDPDEAVMLAEARRAQVFTKKRTSDRKVPRRGDKPGAAKLGFETRLAGNQADETIQTGGALTGMSKKLSPSTPEETGVPIWTSHRRVPELVVPWSERNGQGSDTCNPTSKRALPQEEWEGSSLRPQSQHGRIRHVREIVPDVLQWFFDLIEADPLQEGADDE